MPDIPAKSTHASIRIIQEEHGSLAAMLRSSAMLVQRGPQDQPERFFDVMRAMLFYMDEFPERLHHTKESELQFHWRVLNSAFSVQGNPLTGKYPREPLYDRLFTRITMHAPAPIGLGPSST